MTGWAKPYLFPWPSPIPCKGLGEGIRGRGRGSTPPAARAYSPWESPPPLEQINQAGAEMNRITQQTAGNAEERARAGEELSAQAEQMKGVVEDLTHVIGGRQGNGHLRASPSPGGPRHAWPQRAGTWAAEGGVPDASPLSRLSPWRMIILRIFEGTPIHLTGPGGEGGSMER